MDTWNVHVLLEKYNLFSFLFLFLFLFGELSVRLRRPVSEAFLTLSSLLSLVVCGPARKKDGGDGA
jgi:4-amino-4-deoxy-L-arabinose transferase-like glycosyltransferase